MNTRQSPLINWLGYLAITCLVLIPLSVLTVRSGAWQQGLMLYAAACLGSAIVLGLAVILLLLPKFATQRPAIRWRALLTLPGAALLASLMLGRGDIPPIHDITTDTDNPPTFEAVLALRAKTDNSLEIDAEVVSQQLAAYPDLQTISTKASIESAFAQAQSVAQALGWEIVRADLNTGYIEAVATTAIMAFKDDVVIRLRTTEGATLIDLRSASRVGVSDLGANAKRIRQFRDNFQA
jgi:uncharacterized protein (DUF1499 family)